jgi:hypothetical protein
MRKWFVSIAALLFAHSAFAVTFIPLRGDIEVSTATNRRSAVVTVSAHGTVLAQFCLSFPQPLERSIHLATDGEVVYLPQPIEGLPPGTRATGPEPIAQTLTVIPQNGIPIAFVAKGVKPIVPDAQVILIQQVSRLNLAETKNKGDVPVACGPAAL